MPFCTKCGTKLDGVQKFCHTCGAPAPRTEAPSAAAPSTEKKSLSALLGGSGGMRATTSSTGIKKGDCKACGKPITGAVFF